jgi:propane monooxygenase coupling protein
MCAPSRPPTSAVSAWPAGPEPERPSRQPERDRLGGKGRKIVSAKDLTQVRDTVGISLIGSAETAVAIEMVAEEMPDAKITDNDCFYKIERDGLLSFNMAELSDRLGREYTVHDFLVNMTSYYGRIVVSDAAVEIYADILPERFRD